MYVLQVYDEANNKCIGTFSSDPAGSKDNLDREPVFHLKF